MKYIRTKDGRILEFDKMITPCVYKTKPNEKGIYEEIGNGWIYKLADTIYELCDYAIIKLRFVDLPEIKKLEEMNRKGKSHNPPAKYIDNLEFLMTDKRAEYIIFAIWVNKKLVNVAEMNKEGEIELL